MAGRARPLPNQTSIGRRRLLGLLGGTILGNSLLTTLPRFALGQTGKTMTAHDFSFTAIDGQPLPLSQYRGKAVLVVNTASQCGYTPQYADLQKLWTGYRERGLVVLGVPSNDFNQETGSAKDIKAFCEVNFEVDFPLTDKAKVTGAEAHPLYRWIAAQKGEDALPKWNFHKVLIGPDGNVAGVFATRVKPTAPEVIAAIETALKQAKA